MCPKKVSRITLGYARSLAEEVQSRGGEILTNAEVSAIHKDSAGWRVVHASGECACDWIVTCAGLYSDRVAALTGRPRAVRIVPFRGEYYLLRPERQFLVRNLIYPVPDPRFPFLGVHFTRKIQGGIEAGPNAVLAFAREGYSKSDVSLRDMADALVLPRTMAIPAALSGSLLGRTAAVLQ